MRNLNILENIKHYGIKPNKILGQNFLLDEVVLEDICDAAELTSDDLVLEVGPGIGNLTRRLLQRAGGVISVEKDHSMFPVLRDIKQEYDNFYFDFNDILHTNITDVLQAAKAKNKAFNNFNSTTYKVVANIPYYITSKIVSQFINAQIPPQIMVVLVQKEVAENITAKPGNLNVLGISAQIKSKVEFVKKVPAVSFYPEPKVDSAVLKFDMRKKSSYLIRDERLFFKVLKACFLGKRKQIHNTLKNNLRLSEEEVVTLLEKLKVSPKARPQELEISKWIELSEEVGKLIK